MRPAPARDVGKLMADQRNCTVVHREFAGDQVEQGRLAGAVWADDQPPLAGLDIKVEAASNTQSAERFLQAADRQSRHGAPRFLLLRGSRQRRTRRSVPGTNPSGMKITMATKIAPSRKFHRSMNPLTTVLTTTTSAAPTIGPSRLAGPPAITISRTSAEDVSDKVCGLMN